MSFTVPLGDAESAVAALKNATHRIGGGDITVDIIDEADADKAVAAIHDAFIN